MAWSNLVRLIFRTSWPLKISETTPINNITIQMIMIINIMLIAILLKIKSVAFAGVMVIFGVVENNYHYQFPEI